MARVGLDLAVFADLDEAGEGLEVADLLGRWPIFGFLLPFLEKVFVTDREEIADADGALEKLALHDVVDEVFEYLLLFREVGLIEVFDGLFGGERWNYVARVHFDECFAEPVEVVVPPLDLPLEGVGSNDEGGVGAVEDTSLFDVELLDRDSDHRVRLSFEAF